MTFIKDKEAYHSACMFASYGEAYLHIARLYLRKAYGANYVDQR